jgi:hypothetical protein
MHISLSVPNPLSRLTRILIAVEQGRGGSPRVCNPHDALGWCDESSGETRADLHDDLEGLSLSLCGPPLEGRCDDLDFLSLTSVEETPPGRRDSLDDLSLTRDFPPRPGL